MVTIERVYNVPLRHEWLKAPKYKRAKKAMTALRAFIAKHMKVELEDVKIGKYVNFLIWERGMMSPPHHVKVNVKKTDEKKAFVELVGAPVEAPKETKDEKKAKSKEADAQREKAKEEIKKKLEEIKQKKFAEKVEEKKTEAKKSEVKPSTKPLPKK
jgi:large subunit ribosomal protein L31e